MCQRISILSIIYLGCITLLVPIHVGEGKAEEGNYEDFADETTKNITLPVKMFGPFWSVWCKTVLAEVGVSLPCMMMPHPCPSSSRLLKPFFKSHNFFIMEK